VRAHILHHAAQGRVFGLEMIDALARHGYTLSPGTLYPILHGLQRSGYLKASHEVVDGKLRKYYQATARGRRALAEVKAKIRELSAEVLAR
jgi:DNA-binding PadR family transcriptional regulator